MTRFERPGREESCEKYARLWFDGLTKFHRIDNAAVWYRNRVRKSTVPRLESLRAKLQEVLVKEKHSEEDELMDDVVGKIDPREPDVIQEMRRALRLNGYTDSTEEPILKSVMFVLLNSAVQSRPALIRLLYPPAVDNRPLRGRCE